MPGRSGWLWLAAPACALVLSAAPSHALMSFGEVAPLALNAGTDSADAVDIDPHVAGDGQGNWVVVWESVGDLGGTIGNDEDILVARSSDDGATWSGPIALNTDAGADADRDLDPRVATGGAGVWIATWSDPGVGGVAIARSFDDGASWSPPLGLGASGLSPAIATDGSGNWVVAWESEDTLGGTIDSDSDILAATSADDGASWSLPFPLNMDAAFDTVGDDRFPDLATDGAGSWVAVWDKDGVRAATSTNDGSAWTGPVTVFADDKLSAPRIATGAAGRWVVVWESDDSLGGTIGTDTDILFASSDDDGGTWTTAAPVNSTAPDTDNDAAPRIATDSAGNWYVAWISSDPFGGTLETDFDVMLAVSTDDAATWAPVAALHASAATDKGDDTSMSLAHDGAGRWLAAWASADSFGGTIGEDFDIVFAAASDDCPVVPAGGCLVPVRAGASRVDLRDRGGGKDKLKWKWKKGQETLLGDLGDPTTTSDYVLCLYDDVLTVPRLLLEKDMPAGAACGGAPCWKPRADGFEYKDGKNQFGAVRSIKIGAGADGKARFNLQVHGAALGPPGLPFDQSPGVTMQLHNLETGVCWEALFSTASENSTEQFKARSD